MKRILTLLILLSILNACDNKRIKSSNRIKKEDNYGHLNIFKHNTFNDLDLAREYSKKIKKPIFIMFTGWDILSDKEIQWEIFHDREIKNIIEEYYIFTILYIDDKRKINIVESGEKEGISYRNMTIGERNFKILNEYFNFNSQPLYALVDHNMNKMSIPIGYRTLGDKEEFLEFLKTGLITYKSIGYKSTVQKG